MYQLDKLDRKILYELTRNARQTLRELAQKVRSKKEVVQYRLKNLENAGVIWKYVPMFSWSRLGFYGFKIFLRFHGLSREAEQAMLDELVKNPLITWVAKSTGRWDLMIGTFAQNVMEFAERKNWLFKQYGKYIEDYAVTIIEDALVFNRDYLLDQPTEYRKEFAYGGKPPIEKIDDAQQRIIRAIRNNARFKVTELSKELKLNVRTVISKIKDLEERNIIQGNTTFINLDSIGLQYFKVVIYLHDFSEKKYNELLGFVNQHKNIVHVIKAIGSWELELEIEAENVNIVYELMNAIRNKFADIVKLIDLVIITKELKLDFVPEWY